ncbi:TPA_asm: P overlapped [Artemisia alphacytorhabdovirus 2]|nr:TPA_asm: P overlapped [Artemisia alphacytorhabdovirus 2]
MITDLDPILIFNLIASYLSPKWLQWAILILTTYQTLSLIYRCLKLALMIIRAMIWVTGFTIRSIRLMRRALTTLIRAMQNTRNSMRRT